MRTTETIRPQASRLKSWPLPLLLLVLLGCDSSIFDAEDPGRITEEGLEDESIIDPLVVGVEGTYFNAYDNVTFYTAVGSDELVGGDTSEPINAASRRGEYLNFAGAGSRLVTSALWNPLQEARFLAEDASERLEDLLADPGSDDRMARVRLYAGIAYLNLAEIFCRQAYDGGGEVSTEESYGMAVERFNEAEEIAERAGADDVAEMARLQRARAHLALGQEQDALQDAGGVSEGFRWDAVYRSASGEENGLYNLQNVNNFAVVEEDYAELEDPRVPVEITDDMTPDNQIQVRNQLKYPDRGSDMPMGTWQEARLLEAEILVGQGLYEDAMALVNEVRNEADVDPIPEDLTGADAMEAVQEERKVELFLQGPLRMVDMRRWDAFPEDWETCVPIPYTEIQDNPNLD